MQGNNINLLFPSKAIEYLHNIRGKDWEKLVISLNDLESTDPNRVAFVLMMVRIGGCALCQSDLFRAMRGCVLCSTTSIKRYKGSDQTLLDLYNEAKKDLDKYLKEVTYYAD